MMKFISLVAIVVYFATVQWSDSASISPPSHGNGAQGGSRAVVHLGTVEGKNFYAVNGYRNWTEAKEYCQWLGMELATIETSAQLYFLQTVYNRNTFRGNHWIDARDSFEERQFTWDRINAPVSTLSSLPILSSHMPYQTCVAYYSDLPAKIFLDPCETTVYTLCDSNNTVTIQNI
ncbi:Brevican core protein [Orchesella cincta]|uniref:Brevican core protein n=1 Tax=Orchesella cincta TaxID=48709 RepID=A0A1D2M736_ORCCI|nr:Brevican core protein [Orchesella cincta]